MQRVGQNRPIKRGLVPLVMVVILAASWLPWQLHDYVFAGAPRLVNGATERIEHRDYRAEFGPALARGDFAVTAAFAYSFLKFDRKQNTRLWPFVTTGTTRSPPFVP
jgi:hypothetical protein